MKLIDKCFLILWLIGVIMAVTVCLCTSWSEDISLLAVAFVLPLIAIAIIHKFRNRTALCNILFWLGYNAVLSYGLLFKSEGGAGLSWWFYLLCLNALQFIVLIVCSIILMIGKKESRIATTKMAPRKECHTNRLC